MKVTKWDMSDYIKSEDDIIAHLNAAFEENDRELILHTIGAIARSEGMGKLARHLDVSRESLYKSLSSSGNPSFATIINALYALGFEISVKKRVSA
ncbi:MAG: putative addiction module antidote protein [Clostridiales Family XIII bacterium]|jgi:probable addiction module antidote protein|nr:putative addiction module antidote protein [Clostridiales Family XIII bacterium]